MPKVGGKHFPYTKAGYKAAAKAKKEELKKKGK